MSDTQPLKFPIQLEGGYTIVLLRAGGESTMQAQTKTRTIARIEGIVADTVRTDDELRAGLQKLYDACAQDQRDRVGQGAGWEHYKK